MNGWNGRNSIILTVILPKPFHLAVLALLDFSILTNHRDRSQVDLITQSSFSHFTSHTLMMVLYA